MPVNRYRLWRGGGVSALSRFEQFVESIVEGSFVRLMRSKLQPVEVAKRLARAMESEQGIAAGKTFVPNDYRVALNPEDFRYFESSRASWQDELAEYLAGVARERRLTLFGRPTVALEASPSVPPGHVHVATRLVDRPAPSPGAESDSFVHTQRIDRAALREAAREGAAPLPLVARLVRAPGAPAAETFSIDKPALLIGRAMDNDVVLEEPRVSRYHAEIRLRGDRFCLRDLKSTNGTRVNGDAVTERVLDDGDRISLAGVDLVFRIGQ